jgi:hypothetical protein
MLVLVDVDVDVDVLGGGGAAAVLVAADTVAPEFDAEDLPHALSMVASPISKSACGTNLVFIKFLLYISFELSLY